ncbi:MAG TPA: O-antigen ligase family protein [Candidatus Angelobacter sp.]|nr:O-antigen ligase family protein [Candidatus Angelobacter sp.]
MPVPEAVSRAYPPTGVARFAALAFLVLIATLPWSIAPMSIAVIVCITLTLAVAWIGRDIRSLNSPVILPGLGWLAALAIAALVGRSGVWHPLTKAFLVLLVPVAAINARAEEAGRRATAVLFTSAALATIFALTSFVAHGGAFPARVRGAVGHPVTYGGQVLLLTSLAFAFAVRARERRWRVGAMSLLALLVPALLGSYTRSAWLGVLAAMALIVGLTRARWLIGLAVAVAIVFAALPSAYKARALSSFDASSPWNVERVRMWEAGLRMFSDHPIVGVGLRDFGAVYDRYRSPDSIERAGHLHSVWIHVAATMGLVGLGALGWLVTGLFRAAGRGLRVKRGNEALSEDGGRGWFPATLQIGILAGLVGFLVAGFFEWNFGDEELLDLLYTLVGLAFAATTWRMGRSHRMMMNLPTCLPRSVSTE